jgi:hypothetical protein
VELRDLIVTPLLIISIYIGAYMLRPLLTDQFTRRYFFPALTVRIVGALALGIIYQFYYNGGDTFNYHTHGSRHIWNAFMDSPTKGFKLFINSGNDVRGIYNYISRIPFFDDPSSYAVVRIAAVFDILTFSSYSGTAVLFSILSFMGAWMLFLTFYKQYPHLHTSLAIACLFIPSVFFWGSGLLKDTITLACLGAATYQSYTLFIKKRITLSAVVLLLAALYGLFVIKIYILLTFLPALILWLFLYHINYIRSVMLRMMLLPIMLVIALLLSYYAATKATEDDPKYALSAISKTAHITAYDIGFWTGRDAGSRYNLGTLDGTWQSMVKLFPQAINVSLFRPYLWEVRNPLMLLSALESLVLFVLTLYVIYRCRFRLLILLTRPTIMFCLIFSVAFAFGVGVTSFNFGTLVRYKIPLLPFYTIALILLLDHLNKERKVASFDRTE